jgi:thiamine biosynthesis lipoprotein
MKRLVSALLAAGMALSLAGCGTTAASSSASSGTETAQTAQLFAMDTVMNLTAYGSGAKTALKKSQDEITRLENLLSRTKTDSEVSDINSHPGTGVTVSSETAGIIKKALHFSAVTNGCFDITIAPVVSAWGFTTGNYQVPSASQLASLLKEVDYTKVSVSGNTVTTGAGQSIDLGGIAKGYASDQIAAIYKKAGVTSGMISLGGNVWVDGKKPDGSKWRVAVQDPNDTSKYVGVLKLSDAFAITSGGYQRYFDKDGKRYHHIIDPSTGAPSESGLISATIVSSDNGTMCDALSTAVFVMGEKKALELWRNSGLKFDMVLVTDKGKVLITKGISGQFEKESGTSYEYEVVS